MGGEGGEVMSGEARLGMDNVIRRHRVHHCTWVLILLQLLCRLVEIPVLCIRYKEYVYDVSKSIIDTILQRKIRKQKENLSIAFLEASLTQYFAALIPVREIFHDRRCGLHSRIAFASLWIY